MVKNSVIRSLSKVEQDALALCGITEDIQLARLGPHGLLRDIETAAKLFPELLEFNPEYSRLEGICRQAANSVALPEGDMAPWEDDAGRRSAFPQAEEHVVRRFSAATGRMLVEHQAKKATQLDENRKKEDPRDFSHAIHCAHPFAIYLNAWFTLFLAIAILILLLSVAGLLIGIEVDRTIGLVLAASLVTIVISYAIMLTMGTCSTCRISVFSFRRYPRHRKAHYIPLMGHTLATALYTIFFFRFRCPSCGTPQKLLGRRRHSHRRRH